MEEFVQEQLLLNNFKKLDKDELKNEKIVDILSVLLNARIRDNEEKAGKDARIASLFEDLNSQSKLIEKYKNQLISEQSEAATIQNNLFAQTTENKKLSIKYSEAREQITRLSNVLSHKEKQFSHELKKKETEYEKLRHLYSQKFEKCKYGVEIISNQKISMDAEIDVKNNSLLNEALKREEEVISENEEWKKLFLSIHEELQSIVNIANLSEGFFNLPLEWTFESIHAVLSEGIAAIRDQLSTQETIEVNETLISNLKAKLEEYEQVIKQQNQILKVAVVDRGISKQNQVLEMELNLEKEKIQKERSQVTDAIAQLEEQRAAFLMEKMDFERKFGDIPVNEIDQSSVNGDNTVRMK